jgi:hypothetical protein
MATFREKAKEYNGDGEDKKRGMEETKGGQNAAEDVTNEGTKDAASAQPDKLRDVHGGIEFESNVFHADDLQAD